MTTVRSPLLLSAWRGRGVRRRCEELPVEVRDVQGRARRSEFWWFHLFFVLAYAAAAAVDVVLGNQLPLLALVVLAALLLPSLAATARRLHDTGRSGWWILVSFIPFIGGFWLLALTLFDSELGENKYGPSPKHNPEGDNAAPYWAAT